MYIYILYIYHSITRNIPRKNACSFWAESNEMQDDRNVYTNAWPYFF